MEEIRRKLKAYLRKYYLIQIAKGFVYLLGIGGLAWIFFSVLEYYGWYDSEVRGFFWFALIGVWFGLAVLQIFIPISKMLGLVRGISNNEVARKVGKHFPEIDDRLINLLQLEHVSTEQKALVKAAIDQKATELGRYEFSDVLNFKEVVRYWPLVGVPIFLLLFFAITNNFNILKEGSERMVNYDYSYERSAPFSFVVEGDRNLIEGEDLELTVRLKGDEIPAEVFMETSGGTSRLVKRESGTFLLSLDQVRNDFDFNLSANGFKSPTYEVEVKKKPIVGDVSLVVEPPNYTGIKPQTIPYQGRLEVPEGSDITWRIEEKRVDQLRMKIDSIEQEFQEGKFTASKLLREIDYSVNASYQGVSQRIVPESKVALIKDQWPGVKVEHHRDEISPNTIYIDAKASDDYGISRIDVKITGANNDTTLYSRAGANNNEWRYQSSIDVAPFVDWKNPGLLVEVYDNDAVNGAKKSTSGRIDLKIASEKELEERLDTTYGSYSEAQEKVRKEIEKLQEDVEKAGRKLKSNNELSWEEKENLKDKIRKYNEQLKKLGEREKKLKDLTKKQEKKETKEELDERIKEKNELDELDNLLKEIEELLKEDSQKELQKKLQELEDKNKKLNKKLRSEKQLLEDLRFQRDMLKEMDRLDKISKKMDELSKKDDDGEEQKKMENELKEHEEKLSEMMEKRSVFDKPSQKEKYEEAKEQTQESMEQSSQQQKQGDQQKSNESQKKSSEGAQDMKQQMQNSMMDMQMQQQKENIETLRAILENLEVYSHGIEEAGETTKQLDPGDPAFREMLIEKRKLLTGSQVIEDSLLALSERAKEIKEKVFKEVTDMETNLEKSLLDLQEQRFGKSAAKDQFSMMAANNLALLLDQSLQQMQMNLASMMQSKANCNKPGNKPGSKAAGKKQGEIGKKIQGLKQGKKDGKGKGSMSKEVMKIIQQQEALRRSIEEAEKGKGGGKGSGDEAAEKMKEIEKQLAERNWDFDYQKRVEEIQTRLLEDEKAERKQKMDKRRESKEGGNINQENQQTGENTLERMGVDESIRRNQIRLNQYYRLNQ